MMNITKIEWATMTWNPVTGCLHKCPYCYAEKIAKRFGKPGDSSLHDLISPELITSTKEISGANEPLEVYAEYRICPYPFGFAPTFHRYKLERPQEVKQSQNVFVCSMADLFGSWVPDEWIDKVFDVCNGAPQHRFIFLTKNPKRYMGLYDLLPKGNNFFFGTTVTTDETEYWYSDKYNWFLSIEPIMSKFSGRGIAGYQPIWSGPGLKPKWVIIGAETGNRKGKIIPKKEWIESLVNVCRNENIPVFLKNNLAPVWGEPLIQEYPWEKG